MWNIFANVIYARTDCMFISLPNHLRKPRKHLREVLCVMLTLNSKRGVNGPSMLCVCEYFGVCLLFKKIEQALNCTNICFCFVVYPKEREREREREREEREREFFLYLYIYIYIVR